MELSSDHCGGTLVEVPERTQQHMWILLVEDNPGDVRLLREGFREAGVEIDLQVAEDGERALDMLQRQAWPPEKLGYPNLILLDLNLPKVDGKAVLAALKADPNLPADSRNHPELIAR